MATLTEVERDKLIDKLTSNTMNSAQSDDDFLGNMIQDGFKGFNDYTDDELLQEHQESFDFDFLEG
jgi:DNA polymerase III alpha subunit (gram-positive type)